MDYKDNPMETAHLITLCREGDESAIETLVCKYQKPTYRLALSILEDPLEAEEAAQDALLAALGALDSYRGEASFNTWLHAITVNVCRSRIRKRQTWDRLKNAIQAIFRTGGETPPPPEEIAILNESEAALWRAVHMLDEKHRIPVILRYYHDYSIAEIAQILKVNEGTIHSRLSIARDRLHSLLEGKLL
jgi:RNA polymerase sigma-70 factor (ECF subfamily)